MAGLEKILVVDPSEETRASVRAVAADLDAKVVEARDGGEALVTLQQMHVDAAILLGELHDTPAIAAILKQRPGTKPFVIVLGDRPCEESDDTLATPVDRFELSSMLRIYRRVLDLQTQVGALQAEIDRLLTRDEATGALRRRGMYQQVAQEFARADRYGEAFSLVMIQVAHLHDLTAVEGPAFADVALREMVERLRGSLRKCDVISRMAWDSILVFMPNTSTVGAYFAAEKIRTLTTSAPVPHGGRTIPLSVCVGVSTLQDGNFASPELLLGSVEDALREAQAKGPGSVVLSHAAS